MDRAQFVEMLLSRCEGDDQKTEVKLFLRDVVSTPGCKPEHIHGAVWFLMDKFGFFDEGDGNDEWSGIELVAPKTTDEVDDGYTCEDYTCSKCKGKKTKTFEKQIRSLDEGSTTFVRCVCGHTWKLG